METKKSSYTPGYFTLFDLSEENDPEQKRPFREWSLVHGGPTVYLHTEWGDDGKRYAKLLEQSPELLEALKATLSAMREARDTWGDGYKPGVNWLKAWDNAKAAIAKVEGRNKGE